MHVLPHEAAKSWLVTDSEYGTSRLKPDGSPYRKDKGVTERLKLLGVPASVLLEPLHSALLKLSPTQRQRLEDRGLIVADDRARPVELDSAVPRR
jgi:hypothetical protein